MKSIMCLSGVTTRTKGRQVCAHFSWVGLGLGLGLGGVWVSVEVNGFGSGNSFFTLLVNLNGFLFQGILLYELLVVKSIMCFTWCHNQDKR